MDLVFARVSAEQPANEAPFRLIRDCRFGADVTVQGFTNLYGCEVGDGSRIGTFVEIQAGAVVGPIARSRVTHSSARGSPWATASSSATA